MFCMGQNQSKRVVLEDKVVERSTIWRYEDHEGPAILYECSANMCRV